MCVCVCVGVRVGVCVCVCELTRVRFTSSEQLFMAAATAYKINNQHDTASHAPTLFNSAVSNFFGNSVIVNTLFITGRGVPID